MGCTFGIRNPPKSPRPLSGPNSTCPVFVRSALCPAAAAAAISEPQRRQAPPHTPSDSAFILTARGRDEEGEEGATAKSAEEMWKLARGAVLNLKQARAVISGSLSAAQKHSSSVKGLPFTVFKNYSTLEYEGNEGLIPPELLKSNTVLRPDRDIGQYADLVTRVTNFTGEDKGLMVLAGDVFDVPIRKDIIHRVVRWQLAKRQQGTHSTKTISEVSGTGKKPYKQKGTGRARHGTLRGPQFRHGATMHGPKPRSHAIKLQKKVRRMGLKIALSARIAEGKLLVFEDLEVPSHKTKNVVSYVSQMENTKKVLLVDGGEIDDKLKLATRNLHYVNVLPSIGLNVYSILLHDTLVMTRDAVNRIVERMHTPINR